LRVGPVAKRLGNATVRMLGYNGSIPGPTAKVQQGSEIIVHVTNEGDLDTTVHWHGLRLENRYDGVPHETRAPSRSAWSSPIGSSSPTPGCAGTTPHCPMHPEVTSVQPGHCPKCGMKLLASQAGGRPQGGDKDIAMHHDDAAMHHGTARNAHSAAVGDSAADGIEWEDDMVEVNRLTTSATMHCRFLDRTGSADSPSIDWRFRVGDRVKIRLVNEMKSDHPCITPSTSTGRGGSWCWSATGWWSPPGVEGHRAGPHRSDGGHHVRRHQSRAVDGPLPYRRTHAERHDVSFNVAREQRAAQ
jgi:Multicopper oxidase/Heavy metal binding domain